MGYQILFPLMSFLLTIISVRSQLKDLEKGAPRPYSFGYKVQDGDGDQWRSEVSDGAGHVRGTYGFIDADGMHRHVDYEADSGGFRARIRTNEPGMDVPDPADVVLSSPGNDYDGDTDAAVYGVEAVAPETRPLSSNAVEAVVEVDKNGGRERSQRLYRYGPVGPSPPPVYVVDGGLQSPWFPMDTVAVV